MCSRGTGLGHSMDPGISVQNKNFTGNSKKLAQVFWSPIGSPKSFTPTIPWNSANWNRCMSTPHRSETNGIAEEQVCSVKKAPLPYCCNQVWMKIGGQIPWNGIPICETLKISSLMERRPYERRVGQPFRGPTIRFGSLIEYYPIFCETPVKNPSIWKESLTWTVPRICSVRGCNFEG